MIDFSIITLVVFDVDGVLTDGQYHISADMFGAAYRVEKSFYTRDFSALQLLLERDMRVIILTQSHDEVINRQLDRICSNSEVWDKSRAQNKLVVFNRVNDKKIALEHYILVNKYKWNQVAYMGDAENDLECMKLAGYTGCPCDAIEIIKENSNFVSIHSGGKGCVYDFVDYIIKKKDEEDNE